MSYYFNTTLSDSFEDAVEKVRGALSEEGFGVLTEIDVKATMKKKLDEDLAPYLILGACHPPSAFKAIQAEDKIGTMLPCNVIVQQTDDGVEVSAVDPMASMQAVENAALGEVAADVQKRLERVIKSLA